MTNIKLLNFLDQKNIVILNWEYESWTWIIRYLTKENFVLIVWKIPEDLLEDIIKKMGIFDINNSDLQLFIREIFKYTIDAHIQKDFQYEALKHFLK